MTTRGKHASNLWRHTAISAAIACVFVAGKAQANGTDPTVVAGQAKFSTVGSSLSITNSPGTIINWQGFSIGASEATRFIQQNAASSVLNRVIGPDPSVILGTLTSNGRVFLINPSGILVGQGARIDVVGLVASTLNLSNQDFLAGRLNFTSHKLAGNVENQGRITTPSGGSVYLVGANITNSGIINSPQGDVILAAGQSVNILDTSTPGLRVEITASDNAAINLGEIIAQSGQVGIYGAALRNAGIINADQVGRDMSGKIILRAKQDVTLEVGSRLSASGEQGGEITVQSETGTTLVSGTIKVKGMGEVAGKGGTVQLLGNRVGLIAANVDASGTTGGGAVLIGGDYQGKNPLVQNASATYVSPDSSVSADAITSGNGGKVILWADNINRYYGHISARGGLHGGDGGFTEVSGKNNLVFDGYADLRAPSGRTGTLLLDPLNITIQAAAPDVNGDTTAGDDLNAAINAPNILFADYAGNNSIITTGQVVTQLNSADVTLQATNDITVAAAIDASSNVVGKALTLRAGHDVIINAALTTASGGGGSLILSAGNNVTVGAALTAAAGSVSLLADNDGTGPGVAGGTVTFSAVTAANLTIRFNPVNYTTTSAEIAVYAPKATLSGTAIFDARAWTFINNASATALSKSYSGTTAATLNNPFTFLTGPDGSTAGQIVSLSAGSANFNSAHVASATTVSFTGYGLSVGGDSSNYALFSQPISQLQTITAAQLAATATITAAAKVYDGMLAATGSTVGGSLSGEIGTDSVALDTGGISLNFSSAHVAPAKTIGATGNVALGALTSVGSGDLSGSSAGNLVVSATTDYALAGQPAIAAVAGTITAKALTQSGLSVAGSKIYDATTGTTLIGASVLQIAEAPGTGTTADGKAYTGDTISLTGTPVGTYNTKDVATASTVTFSGLALGGAQAGNYSLTAHATQAALITAKALGIAANAVAKTYDGLAYSGGNGVVYSGFVNSETSAVLGGTLVYGGTSQNAINAGNYVIAPSGLTSVNYAISYTAGVLGVTRAVLGVAANAAAKTYDGLAYSGGNGVVYSGFVNSETSVVLGGALVYGGSSQGAVNVGNYLITPGGLTSGNYTISYVDGTLGVTRAALGIAANAAAKTYDGLAYSGGNGVVYSGFVNSETSAVLGGALVYGGTSQGAINVGNYLITPSGLTSGNYTISYVDGTLGVTRAALGIAANAAAKTYDGLAYCGGNGVVYSGLVNSETSAVLGGALVYGGSSQGAVNVGNYLITPGGLTSGNYTISYVDGILGVIPAGLLGVAANAAAKTYDGLAYSGGNGVTYTGFQAGDTADSLGGTLAYGGTSQGAVNVGNYTIIPFGQSSPNYTIAYVNGNLSVIRAALGIAANSATRLYGVANPAFSAIYTGFQNGETAAALSGALVLVTPAIPSSNVGNYAITPSGQSSANYTITYVDGALGVTPAPLGIATNSATRLYGDANPVFSATYSGFQNGETAAALTGALAFATPAIPASNVGNYAITPSGHSSANYTIAYVNGTLGVIPVSLMVAADARNKVYGTSDPVLTFGTTGLVNNPALGVVDTVGTVLSGELTRASGETVLGGPYAITQGTLAANSNYTLSSFTGNALNITPAALAVAANALSKVYGTSDPALTFGTTGLVNNPALGIADTAATVLSGALTRASGETVLGGPYAITRSTLAANSNYTLGSFTGNDLTITPSALNVAAYPQSKLFGTSDPALTFGTTGLVNNPALGIADTAATVLYGALTRIIGESALGGPYAIIQGSLAANSNYSLGFMHSNLIITGAAAEPVLGFNAGQVVFAGVINNEFYYRPGNFWHISLNPNDADPGFDVMRGTNDSKPRLNQRLNSCDSVSGGGFCETWSFPQQREKGDKK
ncbi:MAG: MBG domain-containing protein [Gallionella sp.]|nr:MBG domain-containing protein [Gallionella sp.]